MNKKVNKIILCIGTSECIGDSLGPLVGQNLYKKINKSNVYIFGNLEKNVTYQNVDTVLNIINNQIKNPYLILVDSALANIENIGKIIVSKNKMVIGSALSKTKYILGDFSIKGVVGENKNDNFKNYKELSNVSKKLIINLSEQISKQIIKVLNV